MRKNSATPTRTTTRRRTRFAASGTVSSPDSGASTGTSSNNTSNGSPKASTPFSGESLVRHRTPCTYTNDRGQSVTTMAHRAGWDATFSAPKSVSLTALVGGDARVREAHEASVGVALDELEHYVQARLGNHRAGDHRSVGRGTVRAR